MRNWLIFGAVVVLIIYLLTRIFLPPGQPKRSVQGPQGTAFTDVTVFDGEQIVEHQTVLVEGRTIASVGPVAKVPVPASYSQISGKGRTLLPGFIDSHVHIELVDRRKVLQNGVTTARDLGWTPQKIFPLARSSKSALPSGPELLAAGPILTAPGGYPTKAGWAPAGTGREVADADSARQAVREIAAEGAVIIKIAQEPRQGPTLAPGTVKAIVEEAHAAGLKVTSHLGSLDQLTVALDGGVDELAHGLWDDEKISDALIARMVAAHIVVVPTLHIDPSKQRIDNLARFAAAGGEIVYGTDMGNTGPPAGIDVEELKLMVKAGLSNLQAIVAATSGAADYLGLSDRGRIRPGLLADLVLVDGDPFMDLGRLAKIESVFRSGQSANELSL